ncbi:MAG: tyrosine-protein phosphatase [Cellvibrionales bacterium TMED148]|nr:hypothetical protein [Porticoccaceae bacterium]RPG90351.1 MAG: tyrosine-protein phosphatase [Cellvibrionales bacterium TMED148]
MSSIIQRAPDLHGGINFRDIGGYSSRDGRCVVWRKLLRSGHLAYLNDSDLAILSSMGINQVHDFRREDEQLRSPSRIINVEIISNYHISVGSLSKFWDHLRDGNLTSASAQNMVTDSYGDCIDDVAPAYTQFMRMILDNARGTSLFHCAAGKDRTGMAAALILAALDIPRATIIDDYMLTEKHFDSDNLMTIIEKHLFDANVEYWERDWLLPYCTVSVENIEAFFNAIDERFGSVEHYLDQALNFGQDDRESLRDLFLE